MVYSLTQKGVETMNIKQAEQISGVSADNIRFYEKQGLLRPRRNQTNGYREYSEEDIHTLKLIRALRMLDMPLEQVAAVLTGRVSLSTAAVEQRQRLEARSRQLSAAIHLCGEFASLSGPEELDIDALLARMDSPQAGEGFFQDWLRDYRKVALAQHEKRFTFLPDEAVTTPQEFSAALFHYAKENDLDLTITKESMYPEFTIGGIEYTATRNYTAVRGCPVASIHCQVLHPEDFEPQDISPARRRIQKLVHILWVPALFLLFFFLPRASLFHSWEGWALLVFMLVLVGVGSFRGWLLFYNENGKSGKG